MRIETIRNPFSYLWNSHHDFSRVWELIEDFKTFVPGLVMLFVKTLIVFVTLILWPYGWCFVATDYLWKFVQQTWEVLINRPTFAEKASILLSLLIYCIPLMVFGLLCLPGVIVAGIFSQIAKWRGAEIDHENLTNIFSGIFRVVAVIAGIAFAILIVILGIALVFAVIGAILQLIAAIIEAILKIFFALIILFGLAELAEGSNKK